MEGVMTLVAEWFSFEEMRALPGVCVLTSVWARDWEYKDPLSDLDDQVWRDLLDDWQKCISQKRRKVPPCENEGRFPCASSFCTMTEKAWWYVWRSLHTVPKKMGDGEP